MTVTIAAQPMTEDAARRITERIRSLVLHTRESMEKVQRLLTEAKDGHAHVALGYDTGEWTRYMADLFADQPLRLPRDQRQELVGYLAGEGMSSRSIAPIVSTTDRQVRRDIAGGTNVPPGEVTTQTPAPTTPQVEPGTPEGEHGPVHKSANGTAVDEAGTTERQTPPAPRPPVTGLDGKTYTPRERAQSKRRPLPDSFFAASYDLGKRIESVHRLTEDDRFPQNAEKVAAAHRNDLLRYRDLLEQVINRLPQA